MGPKQQRPDDQAHTVTIDPQVCNGCVVCMKACPARAIRIREGLAQINHELCVDCGICYRVCPLGAVNLVSFPLDIIEDYPFAVATASPTLFSQFGYNTTPNQVLLALKKIGFHQVVDISLICEMTAVAMEEYLLAHPGARPGITNQCPVVVQLITKRFPSLIPHVVPMLSPRMLAAKTIKQELAAAHGWPAGEIGVFIISPCVAKAAGAQDPGASYLDGLICIPEVYAHIMEALPGVCEDRYIQQESGRGLAWAASGGQTEAFEKGYTLSVSGYAEVVNILEMMESGRLQDLSFIEAHICRGGCLGGPLTVENPYRAHSVIKNLIRRYGSYSRVDRSAVRGKIARGYFNPGIELKPHPLPALAKEPAQAIARLSLIQDLLRRLPGSDCGLCGCPDCATFAHDVIMNQAREADCPSLMAKQTTLSAPAGKETMTLREIAKELDLKTAAGEEGLDREVTGGYCSDLLSDVMAHAPEGVLWLTVQNHANSVAVAVIKDLAGVCLVGGRKPLPEMVEKARQEDTPLLISALDAFTLAGRLHALGLGG